MDFMDFLVDSTDEYLTGYFYKKRPKNQEDGRVKFNYKQLDPNSRVFGKILGEVRADRATYAIKTNDMCGFNIGGYIVTQNGLIWQITEVITNEESKGSNDVLRWFTTAVNAECSVRMVQIDNLYDVEDTYNKWCDITVNLATNEKLSYSTNDAPTVKVEPKAVATEKGYAYALKVEKGVTVWVEIAWAQGIKKYTISALHTGKDTLELTYTG